MKTWKKPQIVTIHEKEIEEIVVAGACSRFCYYGYYRTPDGV